MSSPAQEVVGLEISARSVVAALVRDGLPVTMARRPLARGVFEGGRLAQPKALTDTVRELWRQEGLPTKRVRIGIPDRLALCRLMRIPDPGSRADLLGAVRLTGRAVFDSLDLSACALAVDELDRDGAMLTVSVTAVEREEIEDLRRAVTKAGLQVVGAETTAGAQVRALAAPMDPLETSVIVSVGADATSVALIERGGVAFLRAVGIGVATLTDALAADGRSPEQAAELLMRIGFRTDPPKGISAEVVSETQNRLLDGFDQLVQQLGDSLDFASASRPGMIGRLVVMGEGTEVPGLAEAIAQYTTVAPLLAAQPIDSFDGAPEFGAYAAALALSAGAGADLLENPRAERRERAEEGEERPQTTISRRGKARTRSQIGRRRRGDDRSIPKPYLAAIVACTLGLMAVVYGGRMVADRAVSAQQELIGAAPVASGPGDGEVSAESLRRLFASRYDLATPLRAVRNAIAQVPDLQLMRVSLEEAAIAIDVRGPVSSGERLLSALAAAGLQAEEGQASGGVTHILVRTKEGA